MRKILWKNGKMASVENTKNKMIYGVGDTGLGHFKERRSSGGEWSAT